MHTRGLFRLLMIALAVGAAAVAFRRAADRVAP
jgi:hypothetical protein